MDCNHEVVKKVINDEMNPLHDCEVKKFNVDKENVYQIEISYGNCVPDPSDMMGGCMYKSKQFLVDKNGENIMDDYHPPEQLALFDAKKYGHSCNYIDVGWDWLSVAERYPRHVKIDLLKERNEYFWELELKNFTGSKDGTTNYYDTVCSRSGKFKIDIDGKKIEEKNISVKYLEVSDCEKYTGREYTTDRVTICCKEFRTIKENSMPEIESKYCAESGMAQCEKVEDRSSRGACIRTLAYQAKDPTICEEIQDRLQKEHCYSQMATELGNPDYCLHTSDDIGKFSCISDVAEKIGDVEICKKIDPQYDGFNTQNNCIRSVALKKADPEMCELLPPEPAKYNKENCLKQISN